jgi:hypothetical protein
VRGRTGDHASDGASSDRLVILTWTPHSDDSTNSKTRTSGPAILDTQPDVVSSMLEPCIPLKAGANKQTRFAADIEYEHNLTHTASSSTAGDILTLFFPWLPIFSEA